MIEVHFQIQYYYKNSKFNYNLLEIVYPIILIVRRVSFTYHSEFLAENFGKTEGSFYCFLHLSV